MSDDAVPKTGLAWKWKKVAEVAVELGTSAQMIRNAISCQHGFKAAPALEHKQVGSDFQVRAGQVYEHFRTHNSKIGLNKPLGYEPAAAATAGAGEPDAAMQIKTTAELHAHLMKIATDKSTPGEQKRTMVSIAAELRRRDEAEAKAARMVPEEECLRLLRAVGQTWISAFEEYANPFADFVLEKIKSDVGIDLLAQNIASKQIVVAAACEGANQVIITKINTHVEQSVNGVKEMF